MPLVDDYDTKMLLPVPLLNADAGVGLISCDLTRFGINLSISKTPGYDESVTTELTSDKGLHMSIKAFVDNSTLKCHGSLSIYATL